MTRQVPTTRDVVRAPRTRLVALIAVVGPGVLAGLSDDDPAGITTYSVLGATFGYRMLWVLLLSTMALILFHSLGARLGVATGQGLIGLVRDRYGPRIGLFALLALVMANLGTTCAEFAGVAAGFELFGVPRAVSVPTAAALVSVLVARGNFHRVERLLMVLAAVLVAYVAAGLVVGPDWAAVGRGLVVPSIPTTQEAIVLITATVGTTLAPWGLSFIQSYAVDKGLTAADLRYERIDVVVGSLLTGVVGLFVVISCAETLHVSGRSISSAADAASALEPLAGQLARSLFAIGIVGAALLAAAILPLSTAYSVCEFVGREDSLDDPVAAAPLFYGTMIGCTVIGAGTVLLPGIPLVPVLVLTQVLNALLLVPLLVLMSAISRNEPLMGEHVVSRGLSAAHALTVILVSACLAALLLLGLA